MKSAIEEIYDCKQESEDNTALTAEYTRLKAYAVKIYDALCEKSDKEYLQLLEELYNAMMAVEAEQGKIQFKSGFKMGLNITLETFIN